jgi:TolB-like protein/Tfp pilus assembly protein PilF
VLPFENRSGNADTDYLSDGVADSLIYRLSQLPDLKVSPTSSVMKYKGSAADVGQIAKELDVDAVMSGRLVQQGNDLSIIVQLIDSRTGKLVWAEQYDRKMADLLATQREIASAITQKLELKLSGQEPGLAKRYTSSNEAYQLYLKGRFHWSKRTYQDLLKAADYFRAAIDKDNGFALAYSGAADTYAVMPYYVGSRSNTFTEQARPFAMRAVELDDQLAEAHTSLAFVNERSWNWDKAQKEYERAIELNPSYTPAVERYARFEARVLGRKVQAIQRLKHAVEIEPSSLVANDNLSISSLLAGDVDFAVEQARRTTALDSNYSFGWIDLAYALLAKGDLAGASEAASRVSQAAQRSSRSLICLGVVEAASGRKAEAMKIVKELEERYASGSSDATDVAGVYSALGDRDKAFMWLDKAFADRSSHLVDVRAEYPFSYVSDDQRFRDLLKRMNMPE